MSASLISVSNLRCAAELTFPERKIDINTVVDYAQIAEE
jgi:hypothetical protein